MSESGGRNQACALCSSSSFFNLLVQLSKSLRSLLQLLRSAERLFWLWGGAGTLLLCQS